MYRVTIMSGRGYAVEIDELNEDEIEEMEVFINEGTPIIIVESLDDLDFMDVEIDLVERD